MYTVLRQVFLVIEKKIKGGAMNEYNNKYRKTLLKIKAEQSARLGIFSKPLSPEHFIEGIYDMNLNIRNSFKKAKTTQTNIEKWVNCHIVYNKNSDSLSVLFKFPDNKVVKDHIEGNVLRYTNNSGQTIELHILHFSDCCSASRSKEDLPRIPLESDVELVFKYSKEEDILELLFSKRNATEFVEDENLYGVVKCYAGKELIGYAIVLFSEYYSPDSVIPDIEIPRRKVEKIE
jgi:hypothetical protein